MSGTNQRRAVATAAQKGRVEWRRHALERLAERDIPRAAVLHVIEKGRVVEEYPDAAPFPSWLLSAQWHGSELHVVAALDAEQKEVHVITAYRPDADHFASNGLRRKK